VNEGLELAPGRGTTVFNQNVPRGALGRMAGAVCEAFPLVSHGEDEIGRGAQA
jgi:hypothetical protein